MANSINDEIIDLTNLDYNFPRNNPRITIDDDVQEVIVLVDDSFNEGNNKESDDIESRKNNGSKVQNSTKSCVERESANKAPSIGDCSICFEKLGKKPLASTKCGHVFCLVCLETSLMHSKQCPTCRSILKGASAYHKLYINLGLT